MSGGPLKPNAKNCCTPSGEGETPKAHPSLSSAPGRTFVDFDTVSISGGTALVGTNAAMIPDDGEGPLRRKNLRPFRIAKTAVTNDQFYAFVDATGYVTEAEQFGWSFVFWADVPKRYGPTDGVLGTEWWRKVHGANWRLINGPGTDDAYHPDHPVVQVSFRDAQAYAKWVSGRLPSETEWEHAARGGLGDVPFPWGKDEPNDIDLTPCNIWQGNFPHINTEIDGHARTAPAKAFLPNGFGLYQMVGNVWEWTSDLYRVKSLKRHVRARLKQSTGYQLSKGGSFMCHKSYCYRYRIAARSGSSPDSSAPHHGFRVAWSN